MDVEAKATTPSTDGDAGKNRDEVALELMKFIVTYTGYAKGAQAVGFAGKGSRTAEEQADALLDLFERCRQVVKKG